MTRMDTIQRHDTGPAVEDVQQRLARLGFLPEDGIDGVYGDATAAACARSAESPGSLPSAR